MPNFWSLVGNSDVRIEFLAQTLSLASSGAYVEFLAQIFNQAQLQDIITCGRSARSNISQAANLPDGRATYATQEAEARRMQSTSTFGREDRTTPALIPCTSTAHAKAIARIPAIFGGRPVYGSSELPQNFASTANVEATSPETSAPLVFPRISLLYGLSLIHI